MPKPTLENNRGEVVARLEQECWVPRHGDDHDVYKHPLKPVDWGGSPDREDRRLGRLREGTRDNSAIRGVDRR